MDYESEGKFKTANANVTIKLNTNLAQCMDLNSYSVMSMVDLGLGRLSILPA